MVKLLLCSVLLSFAVNAVAQSDTTPPSIAITEPTSAPSWTAARTPFRIAGTAGDDAGLTSITYTTDQGGACQASQWSPPPQTRTWVLSVGLRRGMNVITITAHDAAGNIGSAVLTVEFLPDDKVPPTMSLDNPDMYPYMNEYPTSHPTVSIGGGLTDGESGITHVTWATSRGASGLATVGPSYRGVPSWWVSNIPLQLGYNGIGVTAYDGGNNRTSVGLTVLYETGKPNLTFGEVRLSHDGGNDRSRFRAADSIEGTWHVTNNGTATTGYEVFARYELSNGDAGTLFSYPLHAGESIGHDVSLGQFPRGVYDLRLDVFGGSGNESDTTDNHHERTFFVGGSTVRADFNFDETTDILWQHAGGQAYLWYMDGNALLSGSNLNNNGPGWKIVAAADFDGDGSPDLLHQHPATKELRMWLMLDKEIVGVVDPPNPGPGWNVAGASDFNRDGYADLLFQNGSTDQVYLWNMNGGTVIAEGNVNNVGANWSVAGTGDFDADGDADIVWRNAVTGQNYLWYMDGRTLTAAANISAEVNLDWQIGSVADYSGDGKPDLLWQFEPTGQLVLWVMNGNQRLEDRNMNHVGSAEWRVAGPK